MGWWSTTVMGGDTPLDLQGDFCGVMGVSFDFNEGGYRFTRKQLDKHRKAIIALIEQPKGRWSWHRETAYQVLGHMILETGATLPKDLRARIVAAAQADADWRDGDDYDRERKRDMAKFIKAIESHVAGTPKHMPQKGLMEVINEKLGT